jgi:hypothetical protein
VDEAAEAPMEEDKRRPNRATKVEREVPRADHVE